MRRRVLLTILLTSVWMILGVVIVNGDSNPTTEWKDYAASSFAGGDGSETNPYQIDTPEQLAKLSQDVADGESYSGRYFRLEKDMDLSAHLWNPIGQYRYKDHKELSREFKGSFDGNGKTITGMIVDQRKDQYCGGFFGACAATADASEIQDLTIVDARIYNSGENIAGRSRNGILVGLLDNAKNFELNNIAVSGTIHVEGKSESGNTVGGMIGEARSVTAKNCKVTNVAISGAEEIYNTGGFVGLDVDSYYENCTVTGTITGCSMLGGFVGWVANSDDNDSTGVFKNCLADVKVDGTGRYIGGFVGFCKNIKIRNCVAKGNVSTTRIGDPYIGTFGGSASDTMVTDSHGAGTATCKSTTTFAAGGFIGEFRSGNTVSGCSFDSVRNKELKAIGGETSQDQEGITGTSTQGVKANICKDYEVRHNPVKVAKKAATCTEDGSEEYYICEACGTLYSDTNQKNIIDVPIVIPAAGHKFGEWKVTKEPTTEAEGIEERTCESCSEKETRSVAKRKPSAPEPSAPEKKIASVAFRKKAYVYNGKTKKPAVKVKDTQGKVIPAKEYTVKYSKGRKKVGTYTVTVKLKTGAKNTVKASFRIIPKTTQVKSLKKGAKSFTVKWFRKGPQVTGYQVQYSTSKNFTKAKTKRIKGYNHNTKKVKKLGKKKTYYVRVRTYKKIGKTTYYGNWSKTKKETTR